MSDVLDPTNDLVAIYSMSALVKFREPLEIIVPVLTNSLTHSNKYMRRYAREALQRIDPAALKSGEPTSKP